MRLETLKTGANESRTNLVLRVVSVRKGCETKLVRE